MIFFLLLFLILFYINEQTIGFRNLICNKLIQVKFSIADKYKNNNLINVIKSYGFDIKIKNKIIYVYYKKYSNNFIIKLQIKEYNKYHDLLISFDHKYFDFNIILKLINKYNINNDKQKKLVKYNRITKNDFLVVYLINNYLYYLNKKIERGYKQLIIDKNYTLDIKNKNSKYISNIDIVIGKIIEEYFNIYTTKNEVNIIMSKAVKDNNEYFIGNPVTLHYLNVKKNSLTNIALEIRNSHENPKIEYFKIIDIYISSWYPTINYDNKILKINKFNEESKKTPGFNNYHKFECFILYDKDNYIVEIDYIKP